VTSAEEEKLNNILATGAVIGCLWAVEHNTALSKAEVVMENGQATNQIKVWFKDFLRSPYIITVERSEEQF
jgi:hypothetical protein